VLRSTRNWLTRSATKRLPLLVAIFLIFANQAIGQNVTDRALITVSGQAEVRVPPDEVVFTLEVESIDKDVLAAKKKTDESVKAVFAIATDNHIKPDDVQTSYISVEPKYNTDDLEYEARRGVKRVFVGYEVSKTIAIRLRDISRFDPLLSDVLKAGITKLSNVAFRDSQIRKHKDQARVMAIKAAQEKAILLAREIGQTIGPAYSITEDGGARYPTSNNTMQNSTSVISGDLSASESDSAIAPGLISVTAQVTVSFGLK
jgi:uncharacterized protein YggE